MHSIIEIVESSDSDPVGPELISLEDLKLELGITDSSEDALLESRITRMSNIIAEWCDRRFALAQAIETFTLDENESLFSRQALTLRLYPIVSIDSVFESGVEVDGDSYDYDPDSGRLWRVSGSWSGQIVVTYSGGYDLPDEAPAMLAAACIEAIRVKRFSTDRDPAIRDTSHGDTHVGFFQENTSTGNVLAPAVTNMINPFRRLAAA